MRVNELGNWVDGMTIALKFLIHHHPALASPKWDLSDARFYVEGDVRDIRVFRISATESNGGKILQRLSEGRNTLSNVALVILASFITSQDDLNTDQDSKKLLERFSFMFGNIMEDGGVLVQRECATSGAVSLPGVNDTVPGHSKAALATAAMERVIRLLAKGHMVLSDIGIAGNSEGNKTHLDINPSMSNESIPLAFSDANWALGCTHQGFHGVYRPLAILGYSPKLGARAEPRHASTWYADGCGRRI
ncbi:uncharacterized protein EDB93DRAFT_1250018 [Suillus bovinus]|uniref:uncharacterized protein n=1 Tax=Suillus bovinus TaxID=48563 RepID=UPI001B880CE1|nr:uncharacterized protein EDB93DRAFT_1250018 [Suillus bovinus]KAG2149082.1 hypothetical protein EDB93DRAFT_1250018 [Suillus bovinus]